MIFHHFCVFELKSAEWSFLWFRAKIHPRNHYFYKVLSYFPAGTISIIISFCGRDNIFCGIIFQIDFSIFWGIHIFTKKPPQKGIPFLRTRARSEPFSSTRALKNVILQILLPKVWKNHFWLQNRKIIKIPHFWSRNRYFSPHGANPYKRNGFLGLLGPIFLIFRFLVKIPPFWRKNHFWARKCKKLPHAPWKLFAELSFLDSEKSRRLFCDWGMQKINFPTSARFLSRNATFFALKRQLKAKPTGKCKKVPEFTFLSRKKACEIFRVQKG